MSEPRSPYGPIDALHAELNAGYGFRVPRALPLAIAASEGLDLSASFSIAWWLYGLGPKWPRWRSIDAAYGGFVPEFFSIASPGVDGMNYGYIVHAPELDRDEFPVFQFDPVYVSLTLMAPDLQTALLGLAAGNAALAARDGEPFSLEEYSAIARALDLPPTPGPEPIDMREVVFRPEVPSGWRYVETEDPVGVLAPAESFGGNEVGVDRFRRAYSDVSSEQQFQVRRAGRDPLAGSDDMLLELVAECRDVLKAGFPGTALRGIRRSYRAIDDTGGSTDGQKATIFEVWADVYDALGRPLLAEVVRDASAVHRDLDETSARWVSSWQQYLALPRAQQVRVEQQAGPRPESMTERYKKRFAAAVDDVTSQA